MEPMLVNSVSYLSVSALVLSLADVEVMNESFLQEETVKRKLKSRKRIKQYLGVDNFIFQK
jgi:hypothetical protein